MQSIKTKLQLVNLLHAAQTRASNPPYHYGFSAWRSFSATSPRRFRMAVIGAGPAGFYTTQKVMSRMPDAKVDMYERLPVPYGLSRFGVAPDHPEVKNCQDKFEEIAALPGFTYIGNVSVGDEPQFPESSQVPLETILENYNAITFSYGASYDKKLGIPGEAELSGIYSAREFVSWYNGLPGHEHIFNLADAEDAVIIGQGNVALDVARILLTPVDVLRKTDITESAIEQLSKSRVKRVHIVGRRGPMQVRLTIKELRELMTIPGVYFHPVDVNLIPSDPKTLSRQYKRLMDLLKSPKGDSKDTATKNVALDFCLNPREFVGDCGKVKSTVFDKMQLASPFDPASTVSPSGDVLALKSELVFRSIGYKSVPISGFKKANIGFDEARGFIKNDGTGRVLKEDPEYSLYPGLYCAGWAKRGPTGVIASTMADGFATGDSIVDDWQKGKEFLGSRTEKLSWEGVLASLGSGNNIKPVTWKDWQEIDKSEKSKGASLGKPRDKFTDVGAMLKAIAA